MKNMDLIQSVQSLGPVEYNKCDSCPARANFAVTLLTGSHEFCRHQYLKNQEKLNLVAIQMVEINNEETN
jgi:hypothetical protein